MARTLLFFLAVVFFHSPLAFAVDEAVPFEEIHNLEKLENFIVLSKKFFRRTHRLQFGLGGTFSINSPAVFNYGPELQSNFYFSEKVGMGLFFVPYNSMKRDITERLRTNRNLTSQQIFEPDMFYGVSLRWIPIYGKSTFFNESIGSFDIFFDVSAGVVSGSENEGETQDNAAYTMSIGQEIPSGTKGSLYWKLSWVLSEYLNQGVATRNEDFLLSVGLSWYLMGQK